MPTLAYVEELDRHGDVVRRHAIGALPVRIGRAYDADILIDDPHLAAYHVELRQADGGAIEAVDLGTLNGMRLAGAGLRAASAVLGGDDVLRIGRTQVRVRRPDHPVAAETPLRERGWDRHPAMLVLGVVGFAALCAAQVYAGLSDTDLSQMYALPVTLSLTVLAWVAVWSLICRTLTGHGNFVAHGIAAFAGSAALLVADALAEHVVFAVDLAAPAAAWNLLPGGLLAAVLYRHLRLTVRLSRRLLVPTVLALAAATVGGLQGFAAIRDANRPGLETYLPIVKPAAFLLTDGVTPAAFIDGAARLRQRVDDETPQRDP